MCNMSKKARAEKIMHDRRIAHRQALAKAGRHNRDAIIRHLRDTEGYSAYACRRIADTLIASAEYEENQK